MPLPGQKPDASAAADKLRTARCNKKPGSKADVPRNTPHTARSSEDETARKFWQHLASDEELRLQCEDLVQFGAALQHFKSVVSPGSKGCPSAVRYACSRLKLAAKRGSVLLLRHRDETADAWEQRRADHSEYESARRRIGAARAESDKDKHGLKVTPGDILVNNAINVGSKMSWKIQIVNASTTTRVLDDVQVQGQSSQTWSLTPGQDRLRGSELLPGHSLSMELGVCPTGIGFYRLKLVFLFSEGFHITRMIELPIGNKDLLRILEPTAPFTRKKKVTWNLCRNFLSCSNPFPVHGLMRCRVRT